MRSAAPLRPWLRLCLRTLALSVVVGLGGIAVALGWLRAHEDDLVFETALSHRPPAPSPAYVQVLAIPDQAGGSLAGLLMRADPGSDSGYWVLHLHGNADSAFSPGQLRHCEQLRAAGLNVLAFDYRGFGRSPGTASEAHLYQDAESAYQALVRRGVSPQRIILWGHSLGSAPAVELATRHAAAALVLFGAFTSIPDAAADRYPYLPVRWVAGIQLDSLRRIPHVQIPVIIAHSVRDTMIPFVEGQRLYAAANPPKRFLALSGPARDGFGGHVDALYDHLPLLVPQLIALLHDGSGATAFRAP